MAEYRIVCVDCAIEGLKRKHIEYVGILQPDGSTQLESRENVIDAIKKGAKYYVEENGSKSYVEVEETHEGVEFITTKPDGTTADNLLSLNRCTPLPVPPPSSGHSKFHGSPDDSYYECDEGGGEYSGPDSNRNDVTDPPDDSGF